MKEGRAPVPSPPGSEGGTALILAISLLFALSGLALLGFFAAHADLLVAVHRKKEREMFFAGEAALHIAVAAINSPGAEVITPEELASPSPVFATGVQEGVFEGWKYFWRASFLPDTRDRDGSAATPVVLFNRDFGYNDSPFASGGYPVVRIDGAVKQEGRRGALTAGMAYLAVSPLIEAGWTAAGPLRLQGRMIVSGLDHDREGRVRPGRTGDLPGIHARGSVSAGSEVSLAGSTGRVVMVKHCEAPDADPLVFLKPGATLERLEDLPPPPVGEGPIDGMVFSPAGLSGPLLGRGLLVVHNPRYDPIRHEASRLAVEEGIFLPEYDPSYSHLDSARQPAKLEIAGGGEFQGIVVADTVGPVLAETRIVGALVTLTRGPLLLRADGPLEVLFSREAVETARRGPLACRVFFKSLPGTEGRFMDVMDEPVAVPEEE